MPNPIDSIFRKTKRDLKNPLNILTFVAHERYEPNLALTGHNFYSITTDETRKWKTEYAPIPKNYMIFVEKLPDYFLSDIDLIISHNPFVHIPFAYNLHLNVPIINIFHTMPVPGWNNINIDERCKQLFDLCDEHIYISEFNKLSWGYNRGRIIHHGLNTELFKPAMKENRHPRILTIANDYINRSWALGFNIWEYVAKQNLPMLPVGDTPGLSKPARDLTEVIKLYQESLIFLNTSTASPIPMSLLEAMSCGCACVSAATCMIPDIIEDGVDGFLCPINKHHIFKDRCKYLLDNPDFAIKMGKRARDKIKQMFNLDQFVKNWNEIIYETIGEN